MARFVVVRLDTHDGPAYLRDGFHRRPVLAGMLDALDRFAPGVMMEEHFDGRRELVVGDAIQNRDAIGRTPQDIAGEFGRGGRLDVRIDRLVGRFPFGESKGFRQGLQFRHDAFGINTSGASLSTGWNLLKVFVVYPKSGLDEK